MQGALHAADQRAAGRQCPALPADAELNSSSSLQLHLHRAAAGAELPPFMKRASFYREPGSAVGSDGEG